MKSTKKTKYLILLLAFLTLLVSIGIYLYLNKFTDKINQLSKTNPPPQTQATPAPPKRVLPSGKEIFHFSHGPLVKGPKPTTAIVDPLDPGLENTLSFSLIFDHTSAITEATAILITDHNQVEKTLTLSEGNNQKGTWTTEWIMEDSYNRTYQIDLVVKDATETYTGGLAFR